MSIVSRSEWKSKRRRKSSSFFLPGPKNLLICRWLLRFFSIALAADRWHSATIALSLFLLPLFVFILINTHRWFIKPRQSDRDSIISQYLHNEPTPENRFIELQSNTQTHKVLSTAHRILWYMLIYLYTTYTLTYILFTTDIILLIYIYYLYTTYTYMISIYLKVAYFITF